MQQRSPLKPHSVSYDYVLLIRISQRSYSASKNSMAWLSIAREAQRMLRDLMPSGEVTAISRESSETVIFQSSPSLRTERYHLMAVLRFAMSEGCGMVEAILHGPIGGTS